MYKVFLNDKFFVLSDSSQDEEQLAENDIENLHNLFSKLEVLSSHKLDLITQRHPVSLFCDLLACELIQAAGGLVVCHDHLLCIFRNGKWDLPKGKVEKGETIQEAACREVEEETGIKNIHISKEEPIITYHLYKLNKKWILKQTFWYEMKSENRGEAKPQRDEGIEEVAWLNNDDLNFKFFNNTYLQLKFLIHQFIDE